MTSPQMKNLLARYGVTTEKALLIAIAAEYTEMCCDPGDEPFLPEHMGATLDEMLEAEYQRIAGGAYDSIEPDPESEPLRADKEWDADEAYERYLENLGANDD